MNEKQERVSAGNDGKRLSEELERAREREEAEVSRSRALQKMAAETTGECIEWSGYINANGYGWRSVNGKQIAAHRHAWKSTFGDIPNGLFVLHRCDNRKCINVDHLFLGTHRDNVRDIWLKFRNPHQKLTPNDVMAIRRRLEAGEVQERIAKDYKVYQGHISSIKRGRIWTHIR